MELNIVNIKGEETGRKIELSDSVFSIEPNDHAIYLDVKQYLANNRQGTHKAKERSEVAGSTRKIKKQKGTGTARAGDIKNPIFRGGGRTFGPRPRDYSFKLNKKLKHLARLSALSYKARNNAIVVVEDFSFEAPKTKEFLALRSIGLLNVVRLYGRKAFQDETRITLDINLTKWEKDALYNDLDQEINYTDYMGVKIPSMEIQLQPGRDVAGLIEAAANNWYLKQQGYSAAEEFMSRIEADITLSGK